MKVLVSIPNTGWIRSELAIKLVRWLTETEHQVTFESSNFQPLEHNRNVIVQRFLKSDNEYLLMIDDDTIPLQNPLNLIDYQKDIISCPVWIFQGARFLNVYRQHDDYLTPLKYEELNGLTEIDSTGTGVILCSRKVLESIKKPFERQYDENGIATLGLDLYFSQKAKEAGFKIYTHSEYVSKHYKTLDLSALN